MSARRWSSALAILSLSTFVVEGCAMEQASVPLPDLDVSFYEAHVHPLVRVSCASLDCHGVASLHPEIGDARPLRLYSEDGLRLSDALRGEPLSAEEVAANVLSFSAVDPAPATIDEHVALLKPLSVEAGGLAHVGGDIDLWASPMEPSYVCLRGWLCGDLSVGAACDEASTALRCDRALVCDDDARVLGCAICGP